MKDNNKRNIMEFWTRKRIPYVFDETLSLYQLVRLTIKYLNQVIEDQNELKDAIKEFIQMFDEDLEDTVIMVLEQWKDDGSLKEIINEALFESKADKVYVDNIATQLVQTGLEIGNSDQRNRQSVWDEFEGLHFNVKWYGAKGDGVTDDTQAIKNAINDLPKTGGTIFFPSGRYVFSDTITIPHLAIKKNVKIVGSSYYNTELIYTGTASPAINARGGVDSNERVYFELNDIAILNVSGSLVINGIELEYNTPSSKFTNVRVHKFTGINILTSDNWNITFDNVRSTEAGLDGFACTGTTNNFRFIGGEFLKNGRYDLHLSGRNHAIIGTDCSGGVNTEVSLFLEYCLGLTVTGLYHENPGSLAGIYLRSCRGVVFNGVDTSQFGEGRTIFKASYSTFVLNGFVVESGVSYTGIEPDTTAIDVENCHSFTINSSHIANVDTCMYFKDVKGVINVPQFKYINTSIETFSHSSVQLILNIHSSVYSKASFGLDNINRITLLDMLPAGPTRKRPTIAHSGMSYFDYSLMKPIWYRKDFGWFDATGESV